MSNFNIELALYFILLSLSFFFALGSHLNMSKGVKLFIYITVSLSLSLGIRLTNFDADIAVYAESMHLSNFSFYYLREPVVWIGQRFAFSLLQSELLVFVLFDLAVCLALYFAFVNYKLPYYAFFSFLCFFPFILGMQNVYRQWVAAVLCLLAFSYMGSAFFKRYLTFFFAGLSHNVTGVFISAFFLLSKSKLEKFIGALFFCITPALVFFAAGSKSSASTGQNLVVAYLGLLLIFGVFMLLSSRFKIRMHERLSYVVLIVGLYASVIGAMFLTSTGAERIAMFSLMLIYPHLVNFFEWHYKQSIFFRILIVFLGFVPILLFGTRVFLI